MLYIFFVIFLSTFFLPNAYGMGNQRDLMQELLKELEEKLGSKQVGRDPVKRDQEIVKKVQNKKEYERLKKEIRESLNPWNRKFNSKS